MTKDWYKDNNALRNVGQWITPQTFREHKDALESIEFAIRVAREENDRAQQYR